MKGIISFLVALLVSTSSISAIIIEPYSTGNPTGASGANATFIAIDGNWRGSTVLWNEDTKQYGTDPNLPGFSQIGSFSWGTGIWGRADWNAINLTNSVGRVSSLSTIAPTIQYANNCYNRTYGTSLTQPLNGSAGLSDCSSAGPISNNLNNWTSSFTGFIKVTNPGNYNFSVLADDGFFFELYGKSSKVSIQRDFLNAPAESSFSQDLSLSSGLYMFALGSWDRLEAGVVDLRWKIPGSSQFTTVPNENLAASVSLPGTLVLILGTMSILLFVNLTVYKKKQVRYNRS